MAINYIRLDAELTGRELFLIKSILNIKDSYGDNRFVLTDNQDDVDVRIYENDSGYVARVLIDDTIFQFVPTINPKSISHVLTELSQYLGGYATESTHLIDHLVELIQSDTDRNLLVGNRQQQALLSTEKGVIYTSFETHAQSLTEFFADRSVVVQTWKPNKKSLKLPYEYPLYLSLWQVGLRYKHPIYDRHFLNQQFTLKLVGWPNFGQLSFRPEFIYLTAVLKKQNMSLSQLSEFNKLDEKTFYGYLNAMILTGHIKVMNSQTKVSDVIEKRKPVSDFLHGLKAIFART